MSWCRLPIFLVLGLANTEPIHATWVEHPLEGRWRPIFKFSYNAKE